MFLVKIIVFLALTVVVTSAKSDYNTLLVLPHGILERFQRSIPVQEQWGT
jgi:hypothetical protein